MKVMMAIRYHLLGFRDVLSAAISCASVDAENEVGTIIARSLWRADVFLQRNFASGPGLAWIACWIRRLLRLEVPMLRSARILVLVLAVVPTVASQSIPRELLSTPSRLELDKPTTEVKAGSTVTYTVTLKDASDRPVAASSNLQLEIDTPSGQRTAVLPAGQSSANFTWQAVKSGVVRMTVRSGNLHPASGLVLVAPSPTAGLVIAPNVPQDAGAAANFANPPPTSHHPGKSAAIGSRAAGSVAASASAQPAPQPAAPAPVPQPASGRARKIQLYVEPLPVYGNAVDHIWKATVSVAALGDGNSLEPVSTDVPIHFNASSGHLSPTDIVLSAGQFSNFAKPVQLSADRSGKGIVDAVSSLGPAGPVEVVYLQPPPRQLRLSLGTPALTGTGSSTATVQVCLLDDSQAVTSSDQDIQVTLTAPGQLASSALTIYHGSSCSNPIVWTSGSGPASIRAEALDLKSGLESITFPSFPWYFVWLAAVGGLVGALISRSGDLFSARWWSHTWRGLVLGAMLGAFFYLFARFGAIALPKDSLINIQNIPVVSGVGSLLLGFLGGLYGRKLWRIDEDKPEAPPSPKPPIARQAAGGSKDGGD